jgi:short subunit dehydrogenase-like uncharacterized protein
MILVYGAYGYTGQLIVREAVAAGIPLILAGRDRQRTEALAREHGLPCRVFGLEAPDLSGVRAVLHCAGPFSRTAAPMVDACLRAGVHYLDITGEISVFEALAARDAEAKHAGVLLLPGAGFDVVPSDCLAAHVARRLPTARSLRLALWTRGVISHGTATTLVENLGGPGAVRREGRIVPVPAGHDRRTFAFGAERREAATIPWGDVSTAFYTTGIPNIAVYTVLPAAVMVGMRWSGLFGPLLRSAPVQRQLQRYIDGRPAGPTDAEREAGSCRIVAEAEDDAGKVVQSLLTAPEGYTLTARTALELARRAAAGDAPIGFQTPARAYGADFILGFAGVTRTDLGT